MFPKFSLLGHSNHMTQDISNVLNIPYPGKLQRNWLGKFRMCFQCTKWVHRDYFVHFLTMYLQCSSLGHQILPPVRTRSITFQSCPKTTTTTSVTRYTNARDTNPSYQKSAPKTPPRRSRTRRAARTSACSNP